MVLHQVSQHFEKGIQLADVQISLGLTELTVMHAEWLLGLYNYSCRQNEIILNGFNAAIITEAVQPANTVLEKIESSFSEQCIWTIFYVLFSLSRL